jgi:hypothetical protein
MFPVQIEAILQKLIFGACDILVEKLWEEAVDGYFGDRYLSAVILGGACAETAHRFKCRYRGLNSRHVHWVDLITNSFNLNIIGDYTSRVLTRIRTDYRNKWVHLDIDEISQGLDIPTSAGVTSTSATTYIRETNADEYRSIFASLLVKQEALDCLWLTAIALYSIYGGEGEIFDPAV